MADGEDPHADTRRLSAVTLDARSIGRSTRDVEHERAVAIYDLIEENSFTPIGDTEPGPYRLSIALADGRLLLEITREDGAPVVRHHLSLSPLRRVVKDYFMVCESYYSAIRTASPSQIEAIDMGRRGLHNEGSEVLRARLKDKISLDFGTARRLFTLVCALHWKG
ncbi:uncharacterized protein (UPF0262 family) [Angulomicrobium tetraedrale]|uniref:UPF0262 protein FHS55_000099 n=1 Tax=Ancylobacter tetraedralis TaxID=217068 RepID=A0A839Z3G7_9HYPH|nr:UPF0262 family protein [Ancylobacter tetraedralis]MBB3769513.1 uncharacterized protein (UPF0262 family) [Ancylobacter tetraedralis]